MKWETVIGLEVHVQLNTKSKLFSASPTNYGEEPNTRASIIDLGFPGVLPVLNEKAVEMAVKLGLSINAEIGKNSVFARKNYFYPDLPKGYQISQNDLPIVKKGYLDIQIENTEVSATSEMIQKRVHITRAHLEEDAGKSLHEDFGEMTGIDLNRAGTPLIEIVSEPDLRSSKEVIAYLKTLRTLVRYLNISNANMQEGSFRCDVNVSVRQEGKTEFGTRVEIKNLNSFRFIEQAISYEVERQISVIEGGKSIKQETRLYDPNRNGTYAMRSKEEAADYRYFPDPDLLPVKLTDDFIEKVRSSLPEMPWQKTQRFQSDYGLNSYDSSILTSDSNIADYFESVKSCTKASSKLVANWILGELSAALNKDNLEITQSRVSTEQMAILLDYICGDVISGKIAKTVFDSVWNGEGSVAEIIEKKNLKQITDTSIIDFPPSMTEICLSTS